MPALGQRNKVAFVDGRDDLHVNKMSLGIIDERDVALD